MHDLKRVSLLHKVELTAHGLNIQFKKTQSNYESEREREGKRIKEKKRTE